MTNINEGHPHLQVPRSFASDSYHLILRCSAVHLHGQRLVKHRSNTGTQRGQSLERCLDCLVRHKRALYGTWGASPHWHRTSHDSDDSAGSWQFLGSFLAFDPLHAGSRQFLGGLSTASRQLLPAKRTCFDYCATRMCKHEPALSGLIGGMVSVEVWMV